MWRWWQADAGGEYFATSHLACVDALKFLTGAEHRVKNLKRRLKTGESTSTVAAVYDGCFTLLQNRRQLDRCDGDRGSTTEGLCITASGACGLPWNQHGLISLENNMVWSLKTRKPSNQVRTCCVEHLLVVSLSTNLYLLCRQLTHCRLAADPSRLWGRSRPPNSWTARRHCSWWRAGQWPRHPGPWTGPPCTDGGHTGSTGNSS